MNIGFIGLGRMGSGMAARVLTLGHPLTVYDKVPASVQALVARGARGAASVPEAVSGQDLVITMVTDDGALGDVVHAGGLLERLPKGAVHAAMGTHGVAMIDRVAAAHAEARQGFVAAPVLGRPDMAAAGTLGVVVGGSPEARAACGPVLAVIGNRTFVAGDRPAAASAIKVANNFLLGCAIEAMGEAFALVTRYGVDRQQFQTFFKDSLFASPAYEIYSKIIADESYGRVGVTALIGLKDANLALAAAEAARVPMPSANVWRDRLLGAIAHGDGEKDWAVMAREQDRASGSD